MLRFTLFLLLMSALPLVCPQPARAQDAGLDDPKTYTAAQEYLLHLINQQRAEVGLAGLRLDHSASEAGLQHALEMLEGGYYSHWDLAGRKPTRRFNLLGGFHSVGENIYYSHNPCSDYQSMADEAMFSFMASEGHRRAILGPTHTHVGLALVQRKLDFYVCQEFTSQVGGEYRCPLYCRVGDTVEFSGRYDPSRFTLEMVLVSWEEAPQPRRPLWLNKTAEYSEGEVMAAGYLPAEGQTFNGMATYYDLVADTRKGWFRCDARLDFEGRSGLYYITLWLRDRNSGQQVHAATATVLAE